MSLETVSLEAFIEKAVRDEIAKSSLARTSCSTAVKTIAQELKIPVGVSARHVHVTKEVLQILYGEGHQLTPKKELMGGQFAAAERVTIVGSNLRVIENVTILGPERKATQVEVSKTDARKLGLNAPIRESGDVSGSMPITLVGPKGAVTLKEGCIVAMRHIHMNVEDAKQLGVKDKQIVSVRTGEGVRKGILSNVLVRVDPSYRLEMHIDTDEANALGIHQDDLVTIA
ncbi:MAG: phosphate propanoyltransferase [Vallitaleaceae bacterium]|nr:phosphate propanoyltransferase [Vallitaleaceae bacterium]